jgi:hypothetical protein
MTRLRNSSFPQSPVTRSPDRRSSIADHSIADSIADPRSPVADI